MAPADPPAVLLGGSVNALSAARSLGSRGIEVYALSESEDRPPVSASRHVRHWVPGQEDVEGGWLRWLGDNRLGAVVIPCSDRGLELCARHGSALLDAGHRPVESAPELVLSLLDKGQTWTIAREAGIDVPQAFTLDGIEGAAEAARRLAFPCAVKPLNPHRVPDAFRDRVKAKALVVHDGDELVAVAQSMPGLVATEIVPGPDDAFCSYYTYMADGEPLFHFTKRKLRQYPARWGTGTYHRSEWVPEAAELGLRLFRAAGLVGLGNVEFKRDERDGRLKLIECNLRLTEADPLVRASGLDLPYLLYQRALGRSVPALPETFRQGVRQWHPLGDLRALRQYREEGTLTAGHWMRTLLYPQHLPLFAASDPAPSALHVAQLWGRAARRAVGLRSSA